MPPLHMHGTAEATGLLFAKVSCKPRKGERAHHATVGCAGHAVLPVAEDAKEAGNALIVALHTQGATCLGHSSCWQPGAKSLYGHGAQQPGPSNNGCFHTSHAR